MLDIIEYYILFSDLKLYLVWASWVTQYVMGLVQELVGWLLQTSFVLDEKLMKSNCSLYIFHNHLVTCLGVLIKRLVLFTIHTHAHATHARAWAELGWAEQHAFLANQSRPVHLNFYFYFILALSPKLVEALWSLFIKLTS